MERLFHSVICISAADGYRYRINWFIIFSVTFLAGLSLLIQSPSLHQFITSSSNHSNPNIEPGLGLSETWYSMIVSMASIGTFVGAITYGFIARRVYFKAGIIVELIIVLIGGLLYSFANNGWLILLSRFLGGFFAGVHMPLMRVYVLETSEKLIHALPREMQAKSTIKYTALFVMFLHGVSGALFGPIVVAIAAQINGISDFHWPGYYVSIHSFILLVLVIVVFNERWSDITRVFVMSLKEKLLQKLRKPSIPHYMSIAFIYLFFIFGWNLSILETLQNPILSDQFGLNIQSTSYVFIGIVSVHFIAVVITYVFQKLRVENRLILLIFFIGGIAGTLIMTDWQSLRGDPCNQFNYRQTINNNQNSSYYCELFSDNSSDSCFWNPDSRLTGDHCERCRPVCLSESHTLNFIQLLVGMVLLVSSMVSGRVLVTTIASDIVIGNEQPAFLMGMLVAAGEFSRATGSLWANPTYLAVDHRTWLTMCIMTGLQVVGLILIVLLYQKMKKRRQNDDAVYPVTDLEDEIELLAVDETEAL